MKKFKALLKSRRGVAIEFAIGVMFITVAVSTILLSTAIHEIKAQKRDNDSFSEKLAVEQYAEEVLSKAIKTKDMLDYISLLEQGLQDGVYFAPIAMDKEDGPFINECTIDGNTSQIKIISKADSKVVLIIDFVLDNNDNLEITSWTWQ